MFERGPALALALALACAPSCASAQDAAAGRGLYAAICARCHADPPGSGSVNPMVRTADEIAGAIGRVSPMKFLGALLSNEDLQNIASYFVTILGEPDYAPDYDLTDMWWDPQESGWRLFLRQHSGRARISGAWYVYDSTGEPTWFLVDGERWTAPGVHVAKLYRLSGSAYAGPYDASARRTVEAGTIAFVFSNRDHADVTVDVDGKRILKKITRFAHPQ